MKFSFRFLFIFFFGITYAQDVIPLLEEGTTWHIYTKDFEGVGSSNAFEIVETVEINGVLYKKFESYSCEAFFREDNGLIYQSDEEGNEQLMYNFNLEVGDFFTFSDKSALFCDYTEYGGEEFEVTEVTTQFVAGMDRKVMTLEWAGSIETWIEGIGALGSLDTHKYLLDLTNTLLCFTKDGVTTYFNGANKCDVTFGSDDFASQDAMLAPNPVVSTSTLQISAEGLVDTVHIFDINGKQVRSIPVLTDYVLINAMDYRAGLYFYQVSSEGKILKTEKFIVR